MLGLSRWSLIASQLAHERMETSPPALDNRLPTIPLGWPDGVLGGIVMQRREQSGDPQSLRREPGVGSIQVLVVSMGHQLMHGTIILIERLADLWTEAVRDVAVRLDEDDPMPSGLLALGSRDRLDC